LKTVILAGGKGTRLSEETLQKPKPLIEIGGKPIIWHIMKIYSTYGINDFIICSGYKGNLIQEYFSKNFSESWNVTVVDTGLDTMTGGRLKRIQKYVDDTFCLTYGDDLKNVNIIELIKFHQHQQTLGTVTVTRNPDRFGVMSIDNNLVTSFKEKPLDDVWINGGYFVLEPQILDYIENDSTVFEQDPINSLIKKNQLSAYKYDGQYQPMDTLKDKMKLEELWNSGKAYWKTW
jgi:glucose-1-phosphate cytidylyltransferase